MPLNEIYEGWTKSLQLVEVSEENKALAKARVKICVECPHAEENWLSKFIDGALKRDHLGSGIGCSICGCPVNELSYVIEKKCPKGYW